MTKQEEIREGIDEQIRDVFRHYKSGEWIDSATVTMILLSYLHSQGVVIKVDRELPSVEEDNPYVRLDERAKMFEIGCGFFEPLIEKK